jgi:hypothetical protein
MRHLRHHYYVGLLTAAAHHSITHQAPQAFNVITTARLRDRTLDLVAYPDRSGRPSNAASVAALALEGGRLDVQVMAANASTYRLAHADLGGDQRTHSHPRARASPVSCASTRTPHRHATSHQPHVTAIRGR